MTNTLKTRMLLILKMKRVQRSCKYFKNFRERIKLFDKKRGDQILRQVTPRTEALIMITSLQKEEILLEKFNQRNRIQCFVHFRHSHLLELLIMWGQEATGPSEYSRQGIKTLFSSILGLTLTQRSHAILRILNPTKTLRILYNCRN